MHRLSFLFLACAVTSGLGLGGVAAHAADTDISTSVSGYGTVEGTTASSDQYAYRSSAQQFKGATKQLDIGGESRLGLQGVMKMGPQFSVTAHALAERRGDKDFDIGTEWLYGQYSALPGLDLRLGRVVLPTFLLSDSRNVGYAAPWLRAPNEVYAQSPFTNLDGVQGLWRTNVGPVAVSTQLSYGKTTASLSTALGVYDIAAKNVINLGLSAEVGDWTFRIAQTRMEFPTTIPLPPPASAVSYTTKDKFLSGGLEYDNGQAIFMSEWTRRSGNDIPGLGIPLETATSWYAAAGWRWGPFTPLVRYAHIKSDGGLAPVTDKGSSGFSLRYDAYRNVALKAQFDRYDASSIVAFTPSAPKTGTSVNVFSLGADFVF